LVVGLGGKPGTKEDEMATTFPHRYEVKLSWPGQGGATLEAAARRPIEGGAPSEFGGRDSWWSPEHLLLSALDLCLMTTFEALARKARLPVLGYVCQAEAILDRTETGLAFTALGLRVKVEVAPADAERAPALLASAKKHCLVANALAVPVTLDVALMTSAVAV
jgi:organic hydroperoxide reductase OsmC/OhrA